MQEEALAPPLYCRFENGFVYGYVQGTPTRPQDLCEPSIYPLIARKMAHWHHVDAIPGDKHPRLFKTLWKWFRNVPNKFTNPTAQAKFASNLNIDDLRRKMERVEAAVQTLNCPVVFCHNDLLSGNIIICPDQGKPLSSLMHRTYTFRRCCFH